MTYKTPMKATDPCELERRIMDGSIAKNEAEWWAQHEIERLRGELEEAKVTRGNGVLVPSDELKRMQEQLAAKDATIEKLREALIAGWSLQCDFDDAKRLADDALAIPTDSTQILDEVRRAERELVAQFVDDNCTYGDTHILVKAIRAME